MQLQNAVTIVTGASSGIGEAAAKLFASKGAKVVLVARSKEKLLKLQKELPNSLAIPTDMTKLDEIKHMVRKTYEHFGHIDILINSAGQGYDALVEFIDPKMFESIFLLDVVGPLTAMQQVIPLMRKQGKGAIVNISSGTALMTLPNMSAYAGLKQALAKLTLTAAEELKNDNIAVTVVYPYITDTNFEKNTIKGKQEWGSQEKENHDIPPADSPSLVAEKILEGVEKGAKIVTAHAWMKPTNT